MRKIIVKILNHDGSVNRETYNTAEDLLIIGDDWNEDDVDMALDVLQEKCPAAFALPDGTIGKYDFEIVENFTDPQPEKKEAKPEKPSDTAKTTELVVILDMSGSMYSLTDDTIGGFNSLIDEQKQDPEPVNVTLITFNDKYMKVLDRVPVQDVKPLDHNGYRPTGTTALLDAIGKTITEMKEPDEGTKIVISITTDGQENASREYDYKTINKMITDKQEQGWEIMFIGANIDAMDEASKLGIRQDRATNYISDSEGTQTVFKAMSASVRKYKKNVSMDEAWGEAAAEISEDYEKRKK